MFNGINMKKIVQYLLLAMCVGFGAGFMILFSTGGISAIFYPDPTNSQKIIEEKYKEIEGIEEVEIKVSGVDTSADINVAPVESEEVRVLLSGVSDTKKPELQMYSDGSTLHIKVKAANGSNFLFSNSNLALNIQIPVSYENKLKIISTSGDVAIQQLKLKNLAFDLSSGDAKFKDLTVDKFEYKCSSGDLNGDNITTKSTVLHISSGNIVMKNFSGDLKANDSSGDIKVQYKTFNNSVNINISSGNVELSLPGNSEFGLNASISSGDIECNFPIVLTGECMQNKLQGVVGKDNNKINIEISSGDIRIIN